MKKFSFKQKGSILRMVEEPVVKKKRWTLDRVVYVLLLLSICYTLIRFAYLSLNVIKGDGQIVLQKMSVNFTEDIRIGSFNIAQGDHIKKGDTLFTYTMNNDTEKFRQDVQLAEVRFKNNQQLLSIEKEIGIKQIMLTQTTAQIGELNRNRKAVVKNILLGVALHSQLETADKVLTEALMMAARLKSELTLLRSLKTGLSKGVQTLVGSYTNEAGEQAYVSPSDGITGLIGLEPQEVCYREQEVLSIHNPKKLQIRAYFNQKHSDFVQPGKRVEVRFKDGTVSIAKIVRTYIATYALPSEFQKKYEPTERNLLVDLEPINPEMASLWSQYYLMDVELRILRWQF